MLICSTTTKTKYKDKVVVNIDDNKVVYYDKVFDLFVINDLKQCYDNNKDKVIVNIDDNDFVNVIVNKDNVLKNNCLLSHYQYKSLLDNVLRFKNDIKKIDDINDIVVNLNDFDDINKYIKVCQFINKTDFKDIFDSIDKDDNVFILKDNVNKDDFDFDNNKYVLLSMNKDIYNFNSYDFDDFVLLSYVKYNYDNDNVKVIVNYNVLNYVLTYFNYSLMTLSNIDTYNFVINQISKRYNRIGQLKSRYDFLTNKLSKVKDDRQRQKIIKDSQLVINRSKGLQKSINDYKNKLQLVNIKKVNYDNLNDFNVFDLNVKDYNMVKQYIIKTNCYFDDLNDLTNIVYKSFKKSYLDFDIKDKVNDIDKDKVNDKYKYVVKNIFDGITDSYFDFDIDIDNDFVLTYDKDIFVNNDFNVLINDYKDDIDDLLKDLSYNLYDNLNFSLLDSLNFDLNKYDGLLNQSYKDLLDIVFDLSDLNVFVNYNFNSLLNDFKGFITYDDDTILINKFFKVIDTTKDLFYYVLFLNKVKDFVINLKDKDNDKYSVFNNDNTLYAYSIYDSPMNKHNSIIKKEQSDFLKVAFNEKLDDFVITD